MMECINNSLPKLPWAGYSLNLIDYFCIIGLEVIEIKNEILQIYIQNKNVEFNPQVISSVISNTENMLENEQIIKLVFPKKIKLVSAKENPSNSSHIFSINADSYQKKNQKVPFFGTCFVFHENLSSYFKYTDDKTTYQNFEKEISNILVPKAFCIISQYPYFSTFNLINKEIKSLFNLKTDIPVEVMVYTVVNMLPSPINYSIKFKFEKKDIYIPQLNGYPVIDFNLSEIFKVFEASYIAELYLLFMLDLDMIFFSQNLELLNFTMYIFSALSYPCNDSLHNWYILSISQKDFFNNECMFANRPFAMIIGVNEKYKSTIDTSTVKNAAHIVVDLDQKTYFLKYSNKDENDLNSFVNFLKTIKNMKTHENHLFLTKIFKKLIDTPIYSGHKDGSHHRRYSSKAILNPVSPINFFEVNKEIIITNKEIQEKFYYFNLSLFKVFSEFLTVKRDKGLKKFTLLIDYKYSKGDYSEGNMSNNEMLFSKIFDNSPKFKSYIDNYVKFNDSLDLYTIPYLFFEEFIYMMKSSEDKFHNYLEIIDKFYLGDQNKKNENIIEINTQNFIELYINHFKNKIFFNKSYNDKYSKFIMKNEDMSYEYSICKFDNFLLYSYIYNVNNNNIKKENFNIFNYKNNNKINTFDYSEISMLIEHHFINLLKPDHFVIIAFFIVFIMTRRGNENKDHIQTNEINFIKEFIDKRSICFRKYIYLLFNELLHNISESKKLLFLCFLSQIGKFIPYEVLMKLLLNTEIEKLEERVNDNSSKNLLEINSSSFIKDYENFLAFNFCYCGFKNDKYFIDLAAEKCIIDSNIYMECETCKKESKTLIKFKFKNLNHTFTSELFSPLKLYNQANKMLQEFKDVDHFYMVNPEIRNKIILNIIFYCKNYDIPFEFLLFYLKK